MMKVETQDGLDPTKLIRVGVFSELVITIGDERFFVRESRAYEPALVIKTLYSTTHITPEVMNLVHMISPIDKQEETSDD